MQDAERKSGSSWTNSALAWPSCFSRASDRCSSRSRSADPLVYKENIRANTNNARRAPRSSLPRRLAGGAYSRARSRRMTNPGYDQQALEGARQSVHLPKMDTVEPTSCAIRPNWMMLQRDDGGGLDECPARRTLPYHATRPLRSAGLAVQSSSGTLRKR